MVTNLVCKFLIQTHKIFDREEAAVVPLNLIVTDSGQKAVFSFNLIIQNVNEPPEVRQSPT